MDEVKVWEEETRIMTYETGEAEKNPMFLDKRVYQGSSGKVYPYPTIEKISDEKKEKTYRALYLENRYLKVMVLPELGGRIQRAYDKTNHYDFVYYNHVIKPALVGLTGPWISGGIEFNWPQHHRPTTFLPVDYEMQENEDGSKAVLCHDVDQINGTSEITRITLYPDKAYIEISAQLYNRTPLPQTFLWWANPAVPANDNTQSIFPPDVHAVMDHGKRDVSRFPIATGIYYKKDYSEGVDISRYKNIPVPTSYMAEKSNYDFVGGYDYQKQAGILHVADHHISPGKKQWTWGCGDFGKAWDRNLTDDDGPYVELMTGVYTDNQPDFSWLMPFEEKTLKQYFMPYKALGQIKNATKEAAVNLMAEAGKVTIGIYTTAVYLATVKLLYDSNVIFETTQQISPEVVFEKTMFLEVLDKTKLTVRVYEGRRILVEYTEEEQKIEKMPKPAEKIGEPQEIRTVEELYLAGLHIGQYRHATYLPDPYYREALKRDPGDIRTNNAYGVLLMRRGNFEEAEKYLNKAKERLTSRNPNPYTSEVYYNLGLVKQYLKDLNGAYDDFYKATWSNEQQEMSFYYLAVIHCKKEEYAKALEMVEKSLAKNINHRKARALKVYILRKMGQKKEALSFAEENRKQDPFDFQSEREQKILKNDPDEKWDKKMRGFFQNYLMVARDYAEAGAYEDALQVLEDCRSRTPMVLYYESYYLGKLQKPGEAKKMAEEAEKIDPAYTFPNRLDDIAVLTYAIEKCGAKMAAYYLGNLFFDKGQWKKAVALWEMAEKANPSFATVHRNLALAYYNQCQDKKRAKEQLEWAFSLNESDARVFLELDQLYKKLGYDFQRRLKNYEAHAGILMKTDALYVEYITLLNMVGDYQKAYEKMQQHRFHPWEGGEGKITRQYTLALTELAKQCLADNNPEEAQKLLRKALSYPENLGEGKLEGTKDNPIYFYLGQALTMQNKKEEAEACFKKAAIGTDEPAGMMYYNDQPADGIMYQGMAKIKLKQQAEANARFYRLIDYGEQHLWDTVKIEYFAVSLPEFQIFHEDYTKRNQAHCCYLIALGNWGLGNTKKAEEFFEKALTREPSHEMCTVYRRDLQEMR